MGGRRERPVPTAAEAHAAAAAIVERRTAHRDPDLVKLSDSLEGVVTHVARRGDPSPADLLGLGAELDDEVVREDVVDALRVLDYLDRQFARQLARWRLGVILAGQRAGMTPTMLMEPLHENHRQGVRDLVRRLRLFLRDDVPDTAQPVRRARVVTPEERAELAATAAAAVNITALAQYLIAHRDELPADLGEAGGVDVDDVLDRMPEPGGIPSPGLVAALRNIVRELAGRTLDPQLRAAVDYGAQYLPGLRP